MAHQCKQMRIVSREGFPCHSVKLVLLAYGKRYEVDSNTSFPTGRVLCPFRIRYGHFPTLTFLTHIWVPYQVSAAQLSAASTQRRLISTQRRLILAPRQLGAVTTERRRQNSAKKSSINSALFFFPSPWQHIIFLQPGNTT
jgi:hypothetical protein